MPVETLSGIPQSFHAGDTVRFTRNDTSRPATGWTSVFVMRSTESNLSQNGTANGTSFDYVLTAAATANLKPGQYTGAFIDTETATGEKISTPCQEVITVKPDLSLTTKGPRRTAYEAARTKLESLSASKNVSVSFNGQSYTRQNAASLQALVDRLQMEAIREDKEYGLAAQGGLVRIQTRM